MSRLIMWNLITLDGYFEGAKSWDLDWHEQFWCDDLEEISIQQLRSADRILFGRVTYEGMAAYWRSANGEIADLMNSVSKVVFSRTLPRADWANTTVAQGDAVAAISALKKLGDQNTFVFGSADLCATFIKARMFDEYRLGLAPVILGKGRPLFPQGMDQMKLKFVSCRPLSTGCVILRYEPGENAR